MAASLLVESWTWYGVGALLFLLRIIARSLHFGGVHRLQVEDAIMTFAFACYTGEVVFMNIIVHEQSNLVPAGYFLRHPPTAKEIKDRTYGSKITNVVEQCQCFTIWCIKACLLLMYYRLTKTAYPKHNLAVKILAAYVVFGFVFMEIFYFAVWCRPFHEYWAVPTSNPKQCAAAWNHLITNAVLNLSSDLAMIVIGLTMALFLKFPPRRKYALLMLISMGLFVVACAAANKAYSFTNPFGSQWTFWYIRECSTAMLIANLPYVFTLFRRILGFKDATSTSRSGRRSSISSKKGKLSCMKGTSDDQDEPSFERMPSIPEFAYYSPGRCKASDVTSYSPGRSKFSEQSRTGSRREIFGKADALAYEDLEDWEMTTRHGDTGSPLSSPLGSPLPSRPESLNRQQAAPGTLEPRLHNSSRDYANESDLSPGGFSANQYLTALPRCVN